MWKRRIWMASPSTTSLPESAAGPSLCASSAGPTTTPSGQGRAPARPSARQVKGASALAAAGKQISRILSSQPDGFVSLAATNGAATIATCCPSSSGSSASAALQSSLANRLRARMGGRGSPLYALSWKEWDMALGPPICALRASAPRTSGSGCSSGWPTAASRDWKDTAGMAVEATNPDGSARTRLDQLPRVATMVGWPTARESDGEKNVRSVDGAAREMARKGGPQDMGQAATLAGWPTPTTKEKAGGEYSDPDKAMTRALGRHSNDLRDFAQMAGWPTPMAGTPAQNGNNEVGNNDSSRKTVYLAGWPTPQAHDTTGRSPTQKAIHGTKHGCSCLVLSAQMAGWPTPVARDDGKTPEAHLAMKRRMGERDGSLSNRTAITSLAVLAQTSGPVRITAAGQTLTGSTAGMENGGQLNPRFSGWLMGYPTAWCLAAIRSHKPKRRGKRASGASATPSSLNSPPSS